MEVEQAIAKVENKFHSYYLFRDVSKKVKECSSVTWNMEAARYFEKSEFLILHSMNIYKKAVTGAQTTVQD